MPVPATSFASLPYELRSHIWSLAAEPRRITNVRAKKNELLVKKKRRQRKVDVLYEYETTSTPAPAIMHVCRESRQHAPYQRAFTAGTAPRWTWVNFEQDIFCVSSIGSIHRIISHRSEIQRLQIRTDDDDDWYESVTYLGMMDIFEEFVSLRDIQIMSVDIRWGDVFVDWNPFRHCPRANVAFIGEKSGLVLTGPQLKIVSDWRLVFSFDSEGNPPDADSISEEIGWALSVHHLTLAEIHEID